MEQLILQFFKRLRQSWEKVIELTGDTSRANLRRKLLGWLKNANKVLNTFGYRVVIVPINEDEGKIKK